MTDAPKKRARLTGDQRLAAVIEKQHRETDRLRTIASRLYDKWREANDRHDAAAKQLVRFKAAAELES